MSSTAKTISLTDQQAQPEDYLINKNYLGLVAHVEVECSIRIGTLTLTIAELRDLKAGQLLILDQKTNEPIEIILNNQVIAKGELMGYEDHFAIQITEVTS